MHRVETELEIAGPFDGAVFDFLAHRQLTGVEVADGRSYQRAMACPSGHALVSARWDGGDVVVLDAELENPDDEPYVVAAIRNLLSLDDDPRDADAALRDDPILGASVRTAPGLRIARSVEPHEMLLRAMIGQQISEAAARTALHRLLEHAEPARLSAPGIDRLFPDAATVARVGPDVLRGPTRRIETILRVCNLIADGELELTSATTTAELEDRLLPLPGIGPWTVGYVALRWLGDPDIFLPGDVAVRNGLTLLSGAESRLDQRAATSMAEAWRPWRSTAVLHAWRTHLHGVPASS